MKKYLESRDKTSCQCVQVCFFFSQCDFLELWRGLLLEQRWNIRLFHQWIGFLNCFRTRLAGKIQSNPSSKRRAHLSRVLPAAGWSWRAPPLWVEQATNSCRVQEHMIKQIKGTTRLQGGQIVRPCLTFCRLTVDWQELDGLFYLLVATEAALVVLQVHFIVAKTSHGNTATDRNNWPALVPTPGHRKDWVKFVDTFPQIARLVSLTLKFYHCNCLPTKWSYEKL